MVIYLFLTTIMCKALWAFLWYMRYISLYYYYYRLTGKYDGIGVCFAPELEEVDHIAEPEWGVAGEHHTRRPQILAKPIYNRDKG